ncbi:hypothetical protein [Haloferula sp.]|uniref:hypothetical protein n=1 Tax=Haloferula sp. TaxID=2497595 RepID=UPI0032A0C1D4
MLQLYRQASSVLRGTSRATNEGWYTSPFELEFQLHLRIDGTHADSWIHQPSTGKWTRGPEISEELILDPTKVPEFAEEAVALAKQAGAKALGVILHIADEFATTEIKPELDNPGALGELREAIINNPFSVLDDSSLSADDHSWRLIPYPAAGSEAIATAIILSRHTSDFVSALRNYGTAKNFPVITEAVSAPLVALLSLPDLKKSTNEHPFIAMLPYSRFTVLAFFNEHGDLRLLRTLQHRGQRRPSNLRHAAATTAAALEMSNPEIYVMPMGGEPDPQMASDLKVVFDSSSIQEIDWTETPYHIKEAADVTPELIIAADLKREPESPLAASHTFSTLRADGWANQDFLPLPAAEAEVFPARSEMKLIRAAKYARLGLVAATLIALIWVGFGLLDMVRKPEWTFNQPEAEAVQSRLASLGVERQRIMHWDNLLEDRSKGWASMELLARLFPDKSGFLIKGFSHTATPENLPGQSQAGFVKEWRISGLAREEALERLADLNTREGITSAFTEVARVTGNQSYRTDLPSRSVVVNVKTLEHGAYKPMPPEEMVAADETTYPFMFDLTITQRFEAADPMALNVAKAP